MPSTFPDSVFDPKTRMVGPPIINGHPLINNPLTYHRALMQSAPHTFGQYASDGKWIATRHISYIGKIIAKKVMARNARIIVNMPARHGKQIAHTTPILTANRGWTTHGDLRPGDYVFGLDGLPTEVVAVSDDTQATLKVLFTDGTEIKCHENHEWLVYVRSTRKHVVYETRDLVYKKTRWGKSKNIRKLLSANVSRAGNDYDRCQYQMPNRAPVAYPEKTLPLHPYYMGVWLGDGKSADSSFCFADKDVATLEGVMDIGMSPTWSTTHKTTGVNYVGFKGISQILKSLGVQNNKHIPRIYLESSIQQRLELLAGIIDTDGHVDEGSRVRIVTVSPMLRDSIVELITGLGWNPYVMSQEPTISSSGIEGRKTVWTVGFQPSTSIPTRIHRKKITRPEYVQKRVGILSVTPCAPEPGRCIQVAASDGVYLVGKKLTPTHNSELISKWTPIWFLENWPTLKVVVASNTQKLATDWGRKVRDEFKSNAKLTVKLREDVQSVGLFHTTGTGSMMSVGVGSSLLGFGYHLGIIDDPYSGPDEAYSPSIREGLVDWFEHVFYTRREPGASIIVLMHRMHPHDICNYLQTKHGDKWDVIRLPAVAEPGDPLGRAEGEALWPERWPVSTFSGIEQTVFKSMYQQDPPSEMAGRVYDHFFDAVNTVQDNPSLRFDLPLILTLDFNVNPGMHALLGTYDTKEDMFYWRHEIHGLRMKTEGVMLEFGKLLDQKYFGKFLWPELHIHGDRSGKSEHSSTADTDYHIIVNWLKARNIRYKLMVPDANPSVKFRIDTVNEALRDPQGMCHMKVHHSCIRLLTDFREQEKDEDGQPDKTNQELGHSGDACGYAAIWKRPVRRFVFETGRAVY